jgi:pimeloyl-ACP methyl ester carboxylesterase
MPLFTVPSGVQIYYFVPSAPPDRATSPIDPTRPTVILLHPWFFDSRLLARQYEDSRLARGYNLVVIDHHHHGKTQLPLDNEPYNWRKAGTARRIHAT